MEILIVIGMWIFGAIMVMVLQKVAPGAPENKWYPAWVLLVCVIFTLSSLIW